MNGNRNGLAKTRPIRMALTTLSAILLFFSKISHAIAASSSELDTFVISVTPNTQYQIVGNGNLIGPIAGTVFMGISGSGTYSSSGTSTIGSSVNLPLSTYWYSGNNTTVSLSSGYYNRVGRSLTIQEVAAGYTVGMSWASPPVLIPQVNPVTPVTVGTAITAASLLQGSVTFGQSTDPTKPYAVVGKFTPANGMPLSIAAQVLGFNHFNWIQTVTFPSNWHVVLAPLNPLLPAGESPVPMPILDPAPISGYTYQYTSDEPAAKGQQFRVPLDTSSDGNGFYYNEGSEVQNFGPGDGNSFYFKDAPSFPDTFLGSGDSVQFETRLVGVKSDGSYQFLPYDTGFTWHSNAVFSAFNAISGHVYGMSALKQTDETLVPTILSGGAFGFQAVPEPASLVLLATGSVFIVRQRDKKSRLYS